MPNNLEITVKEVPIPEGSLTRVILALNCLITAENPYDENHAEKWLILYEIGMVDQGKLLVPPGILLAQLKGNYAD